MKMELHWENGSPISTNPSPKQKILEGLMGCMNYDLLEMFGKAKIAPSQIEWTADAEQTETQPKIFSTIQVTCNIKGNGIPANKASRFMWLSIIKYCGVHRMLLNSGANIEYNLYINNEYIEIKDSSYDYNNFNNWITLQKKRTNYQGIALITGTSRGIGKELVKTLSESGYATISLKRSITAEHNNPNEYTLQFEANEPYCYKTLKTLLSTSSQKISLLIHNASILDWEELSPLNMNQTAITNTLKTNTISPILLHNSLQNEMEQNALTLFISSYMGTKESAGFSAPSYRISKAAIAFYTHLLSEELKNINSSQTVIAIHPGSVQTDMNPTGKISVAESVNQIINIINDKTITSQSGSFLMITNEKIIKKI